MFQVAATINGVGGTCRAEEPFWLTFLVQSESAVLVGGDGGQTGVHPDHFAVLLNHHLLASASPHFEPSVPVRSQGHSELVPGGDATLPPVLPPVHCVLVPLRDRRRGG